MRKLAILDDYQRVALSTADWSAIRQHAEIHVFDRPFADEHAAAAALRDFEMICLLRERMPVPASLIAALPNLKFICITGAHNRTLDIAAARARGIVVSHTGNGASEFPTAELAWALILAAARYIPQEDRALRAGTWQTTIGTTLHGKTLGLVGLGRIGRQVAAIGRAFGMSVVAWSPHLTAERAEAGGAMLVGKNELFASSDVVSLHLVLGETTRGIVGAAEFARMRPGALLVNTARGPLIDEAALLAALRERRIRAALDVYDREPLPRDHPLLALDNVVLAPHLGFVVDDVYSVFFNDAVENVAAYLAGQPIRLMSAASR